MPREGLQIFYRIFKSQELKEDLQMNQIHSVIQAEEIHELKISNAKLREENIRLISLLELIKNECKSILALKGEATNE